MDACVDKNLRVLHLEDDLVYIELVRAMLEKEGLCASTVAVGDLRSFREHLENEQFDIILADYCLPTCTGLQALEVARSKCPDTPFLLVSGSIEVRMAVESLKRGATDYVLKHWPERLVPAVRRAVQGAQERTKAKRAEAELIHRERYFRALTENSLDVVTILTRDGLFHYNSPSIKRTLGYEPEELVGRDAFQLVHPDDLPGVKGAFERALQDPQLRITIEFRCLRQDGSWCYLDAAGQNHLDDPKIGGVVVNSRDVTRRKQAEARLRVQSAALEAAANAIVITDRSGKVIWANPAFTRLTGYSSDEVVGQNPRFLKSGHHDQTFYRDLWDTILAGRVWRAEMVNRRKDGTHYTEEATITPVGDEQGEITHFVAVKQDVTERRQLESRLRQAQKMEAIGQLAGGVAHDFSNLLLVMRGNAELLLLDSDNYPEQTKDSLKQITAAAERAANLTRQLLAFSRKQVMQSQPLALGDVIANLTKMLKRLIGEHIDLQCHYGSHVPLVQADVGMLEQVLVNLVINARDAMPRGGQLDVATERVMLDRAAAEANPEARAGEFVCLTVRDTGIGITDDQLPHIFEPFYTTKEPGKGTGLGLATVYGIVQQHRGWIEVSSAPGRGTAFKIFLPALPQGVEASQSPEAVTPLRTGTETILLVEDETLVRMITRRMLEAGGYKVHEAASGPEALRVWSANSKEIALVLTDIVMPEGMSGRELATFLHRQKPGVKTIFMSGYSAEIAGKDTQLFYRKDRFLQKPCSSRVLLERVRSTLDESRDAA